MLNNNLLIKLSMSQLVVFGIQVGHFKKLSCFLAGWFWLGWRDNVFIINLIKTFIFLKLGLKMATLVAKGCRPFWFVTMNETFSSHIVRFAHICGEPFNVYEWIGGTLSNYRMILGWFSILLLILSKNKYKLRHMDKKNLVTLVGHLNKKIYNKIFVKRFNRTRGKHVNRWRKTYNGRRFIKEYKKSDRSETLVSKIFNEFPEFATEYAENKKDRVNDRVAGKRGFSKALAYNKKLRYKKLLYSKIFIYMNLLGYRSKGDLLKKANLGSLKDNWYKFFGFRLNKKRLFFIKNKMKSRYNKIKNNIFKVEKKLDNINWENLSIRYQYRYNRLLMKQEYMNEKYEKRIFIFRKATNKRYYNSKFLTILLLKGQKRVFAKIKKLKKKFKFS